MRIAILSGGDGWHVRDLVRAANDLGHAAEPVDFRTVAAGVGTPVANAPGSPGLGDFDAVIVRTMPPGSLEQVVFRMDVLHAAAARGIAVLNSPRALEACIDKYLALVRLEQAGLPVPETVVCQTADDALAAFDRLGRDVVVKPIFGSEGRGLMRVTDPELAWRTFRAIERTQAVLYLQRFVAHPGWDLRAFVLGGRVLAAIRRTARDDWRTNVAQGARAEPIALTPEQESLAVRAADAVGAIAAGVDLLPGPGGTWYVVEVNAVPGWRALGPATGVDVARAMIAAVSGGQGDPGGRLDQGLTPLAMSGRPVGATPNHKGPGSPEGAKENSQGRKPLVPTAPVAAPMTAALLACLWEATTRKAGNVHRAADFADVTYADFTLSAVLAAPELGRAADRPLGETVLAAVRATRAVVRTNTNLGIVLLLAPLAKVPAGVELRAGVADVLARTTIADSAAVFEAIRLAAPGGLGKAKDQDVNDAPTLPLRDVMALAADRDLVARQYATDFADVFDLGVPALLDGLTQFGRVEPAVQHCQLAWLAAHPDSLIARKRGPEVAAEASRRARAVVAAGGVGTAAGRAAYDELDGWLRADGHARNPGTTADLVTACLFAALRDGLLTPDVLWSE
jgi:RimK family alpha-L-glutamate ligase